MKKWATLVDVDRVVREKRWLCKDIIPKEDNVMIAGQAGIGKSLIALGMSKCMLDGEKWPGKDGPRCEKIPFVLWVDTEATQGILRDRARALGIPLDKLVFPFPPDAPLTDLRFDDTAHFRRYREALLDIRPQLAIIDSLCGSHGGDEDKARTMTELLVKIQRLNVEVGCTTASLHHLKKRDGKDLSRPMTLDDIRGSGAIASNNRVILAAEPHDFADPEGLRVLKMLKNNLRPFFDPLGFDFDGEKVLWQELPGSEVLLGQREKARETLKRLLPRPESFINSLEVKAATDAEGIHWRTVGRAKAELGIISRSIDGHGSCFVRPAEWPPLGRL
jgi:hypothetical protein